MAIGKSAHTIAIGIDGCYRYGSVDPEHQQGEGETEQPLRERGGRHDRPEADDPESTTAIFGEFCAMAALPEARIKARHTPIKKDFIVILQSIMGTQRVNNLDSKPR